MKETLNNLAVRFSPEVEAVLHKAGWFPGRRVEESRMVSWYAIPLVETAGYHYMFPAAYRFLHEFGDLHIVQDAPGISRRRRSFILDPLQTEDISEYFLIHYEWLRGSSFFPIGIFPDQYVVILIDSTGKVWLDVDSPLLIGNDVDEAITNLITGNDTGFSFKVGDEKGSPNFQLAEKVHKAIRNIEGQL